MFIKIEINNQDEDRSFEYFRLTAVHKRRHKNHIKGIRKTSTKKNTDAFYEQALSSLVKWASHLNDLPF